ncbi:MAG: BMP family ABC transporter substrate-binding protein [Coriobacteriia bacterium]|nr:BMP family ABC transporter substrate-binding protein [Coriobacteriia bacterium]
MSWKKVLLLALAVLLAIALVGCGGGSDDVVDTTDTTTEEEVSEGLRIAIVTSPSGVDDGSFNQNNYEGIQAFIKTHPESTVNAIRETDSAMAIPAVEAIVGDYDVIVTPGFQFSGITEIARANPDKYFILVDAFPADPDDPFGDPVEVDNIYAMQFAEQESGFFAGVAAALETKTGKVAFIGGAAYPAVVNYQFGFDSGVAYANKHFDTDAEVVEIASYAGTDVFDNAVGGNYVGAFDDEAGGKRVAEALLGEGADVLFVAAGGSGNGAFTAVKESQDAWVIGCDVDQFADGADGDRNIVLTSGLKVMDINVERQLNAIASGTFKGGNYTLQADTDSTGFVNTEGHHQLSEDTLEKLNALFEDVKSGAIVPAGQFTDFGSDDFVGL